MSVELWVDRYIPNTLDNYVWRDQNMRKKFEEFLSDGAMPHLLLAGRAGLGKTSLAKMMLRLLGVPEGDILIIKASNQRKIDTIQEQIMRFVQTYPMIDNLHGIKYILLDEADMLSITSQRFLRSEMESFSNTARFILTCNYPQKIDPAILSRCQKFFFEALDMENFIVRVSEVLTTEGVVYELDDLAEYIESSYPDLRDCLGNVQLNVMQGRLMPKPSTTKASMDWMLDAVKMFKSNQHNAARKMIIAQTSADEYDDVFRWMYENIELWGQSQDQQDDALVVIRDGLYKSNFVADKEINLSATIAQLIQISRN